MIQIVDSEVGVQWFAATGEFEAGTEFICAHHDEALGWFSRADLDEATLRHVEVIGDISLRSYKRYLATIGGSPKVVIRCGDFALVLDQARELELANGGAELAESLLDQPARILTIESLTGWQGGGPLPPPERVNVWRGCRLIGCGIVVRLPPRPSPCPNRELPRHEFV